MTDAERHLAASACVSHTLRNLLAPAQLRLDAWMLADAAGSPARPDLPRLQGVLQEIACNLDGLELLSLSPVAETAVSATPWPHALHALLHSIAGGTPCDFEVSDASNRSAVGDHPTLEAPHMAGVPLIAHLLSEIALQVKSAAPHAAARYRVHMDAEMVRLHAECAGVHTPVVVELEHRLQRTLQAVVASVPVAAHASDAVHVVHAITGDDHSTLQCRISIPASLGATTTERPPAPHLTEAHPFSVLCIDDSTALLDALEARLHRIDGFSHFVRSPSVADALTALDRTPVSLILVDVHLLTPHDPFASIQILRAHQAHARVALFSGSADYDLLERAAAHGADGFIFKSAPSHQLIDAIVRLARGERVWIGSDR